MVDFADKTTSDKHAQSFRDAGSDLTRQAVEVEGTVEGSFAPSGLRNALKVTTMNITDTAGAIPATALTDRNAITIHNLDVTETIYVGNSDVEADRDLGTTAGWEILPGSFLNFDITDDITLYGIAESGKTVKIKVMEIS